MFDTFLRFFYHQAKFVWVSQYLKTCCQISESGDHSKCRLTGKMVSTKNNLFIEGEVTMVTSPSLSSKNKVQE